MSRRLVSPTLVGREAEIAAVARTLDSAMSGVPVHRLIAGEAGVGKSRLVHEAAAMASARGIRVLVGGCADIGDGGVPYGPIVEALRALVREAEPDLLDLVIGTSRLELARLVPSLGAAAMTEPAAVTESFQARLLDAVLGVFQRLSEVGPVVFVVEDLHWADPATRETLAFLIRQLRTDRVVLLMTFRGDELHRRHPLLPWLAELERSGRVERSNLDRLDEAQTAELLTAILGEPPADDLVVRIHQRSDGNPFFVEELLGAGEDGAFGRLPPTLREVLLARIVALPEPAQAVVGVAAVAGRRVDHDVLERVATMDDGVFNDALRTAVSSQILVTGSVADDDASDYSFRHALLQEAAYDDLLPGERQRLHRAFAEVFAERIPGTGAIAAGHWAELAYHWSSARDDRRAFEASIRAGGAAARAFAFDDARRHDERALELWSTIDGAAELAGFDRVTLLDRAAVAAWLAGDARRPVVLRREAVAALGPDGDPVRMGIALEQLGRSLWANAESEAALEACEAAVAAMPDRPPTPERARILSGYGQILMLLDRWSESMVHCEAAIAMARQVGARQAEGHALNTLGLALAAAGRSADAVTALDSALAIAYEVANADDIGRAYVNLSEAKRYAGDLQGAADAVRAGIIATEDVGVASTYGNFVRANGISIDYELGAWDEADEFAAESVAITAQGKPKRRYGLAQWVSLLVAQGDPRAAAYIEELRTMVDGFPVETQFNSPLRVAIAEAALWQGEPAEALASILRGLHEVEGHQWPRFHLRLFRVGMRAAADLAEVARARRDVAGGASASRAGEDFWEALQPILAETRARQHGQDLDDTDAEAATIDAERGRLLAAPTAGTWQDAAERWQARDNPYMRAYCLWRDAEVRLGDGDRPAAAESLAQAYRIASGLRARPVRSAIEALAARARLDLATTPAGASELTETSAEDPFGLTRRERDVLPLIVKGRTNRQIAEELFISENTAGVHVSNILGKMGATSRTEAAGIAARLGIGGDED